MPKQKILILVIYLSAWLLFFIMPLVFMSNEQENSSFFYALHLPSYWFFCLSFLFLFYFLNYFLIPFFYFKGRYTLYFSILFLLFVCFYFLKPFNGLMESNHPKPEKGMMHIKPFDLEDKPMMHPDFPPKRDEMHKSIWFFDISTVFLFLMIVGITMATQINRRLDFSQKQALKAEADKAEAELSFLKAQINPHFLFNTLNNIYTLALSSNPNTAESIMKLSNIMRYVTDEVENDWVDLEDELNCINDYIALQKLRLGDKAPVDVYISGNLKNVKIAPLLLMTFVENAFKYGVSKQNPSPIFIRVNVNDREIHFRIQNSIFSNNNTLTRKGIGIANTKRRLEHIYPDKHYLEIVNEGNKYLVDLVLDTI